MTKRPLSRSSSSVGRASPAANNSAPVDAKLLHLVNKLTLNESNTDVDYIINCLRTQYREYQRKDSAWLRQNVERALAASNNTKKRQLESDEEYDREAERREQLLESTGGGSRLNAGLRDRYRQVQQERDVAAAAAAASQEEATTDTTPVQASTSQHTPKSTKRIKRKKSRVFSSSASSMLPDSDTASFTIPVPRPSERYSDLGGISEILQQIRQLIEYPLVRPEVYQHLGVDPPRGVLLRGPPGCGKSHLANAIAGQLGLPYFRVSAPELVSGMSGESESRIRELFQAASNSAPSLMFLDELDAICPKRSDSSGARGMEKRMVAQLLTCMDLIAPKFNRNQASVIVLGATNRPDAMDAALRRAGRFDKEILLGVPDEKAREGILRQMTKTMRLSGDFDFKVLSRKTPGYVGADVKSLTKEAAVIAINRIFRDVLTNEGVMPSDAVLANNAGVASVTLSCIDENTVDGTQREASDDTKMAEANGVVEQTVTSVTPLTPEQMEPLYVTMADFLSAIPHVQPSSKREGFATVPDVSWDDVGALQQVREELTLSVLEPIRSPETFHALGLSLPAGVLLYGPPGCGKTLLAKAIAHESGANFISVKGPELLDKYVGESERAVRVVFERARSSSPCVVFFDELDSLCPKRGSDSGGGGVSERVVNQLLTEMDGLDSRRSVFVIAATNRPELIDPAMMRP
jgi:ribosome biogenesis ATPase